MNASRLSNIPFWVQTWWLRVPEPRELSALFTVVYLVSASTGLAALFNPPLTLVTITDRTAVGLIAALLVAGALLAGAGGWREYWRLERIGLFILISAEATYFGLIAYLQIVHGSGARHLQLGTIAIAIGCFVARYLMIKTFTRRPGADRT